MPFHRPGLVTQLTFLLALSLTMVSCQDRASTHPWSGLTSADDLMRYYPQYIHQLFHALDLDYPGLDQVRSLLERGDTSRAADALLHHYQQVDRPWVAGTIPGTDGKLALRLAQLLCQDSLLWQDTPAGIPRAADGGWQWDHTGPHKDDEFGYTLNGQKYLTALVTAWQRTGDEAYIQTLDRVVRDWIIHHPLPAPEDSIYLVLDPDVDLDWRDIGEVEWRTLETGHRLGVSWTPPFYALQSSPSLRPATRLMMLSSLTGQAGYLYRYHKSNHNWTTMEMNGLGLTALAFPEFAASETWSDYAWQVMEREIGRQVYPDGTQTEISTKTQWVALQRFESMYQHYQKARGTADSTYVDRLQQMYSYLAYAMRPDGHQPLNNDSDREDLRPRVLDAATRYGRPDWQYIATNGAQGKLPDQGPSITFPWAGVHIMRNEWRPMAHWSLFDTGPYGTGHQHRDMLHLSIAAYGEDLLVDGGRYTHEDYFSFDPTVWRGYFRSSHSHNVILVDGQGQQAGPLRTDAALVDGRDYLHHRDYTYASGRFSDGFERVEGPVKHRRSVLYLRDQLWLVLDVIDTDRPRTMQVLWHLAPQLQPTFEDGQMMARSARGTHVSILPIGDVDWRVEVIKGQETPHIQGWYSPTYGTKVPNACVTYEGQVDQPSVFAWLLLPAQGELPSVSADMRQGRGVVYFRIQRQGLEEWRVAIPVSGEASGVSVR